MTFMSWSNGPSFGGLVSFKVSDVNLSTNHVGSNVALFPPSLLSKVAVHDS